MMTSEEQAILEVICPADCKDVLASMITQCADYDSALSAIKAISKARHPAWWHDGKPGAATMADVTTRQLVDSVS